MARRIKVRNFGGSIGGADGSSGNNSQVDFGNVLNFGTSDFSWSFWVKPINLAIAGSKVIIGKKAGSASTDIGFFIRGTTTTAILRNIGITMDDGSHTASGSGSNNAIIPGAWNNVVVTFARGGLAIVYVNGVQDFTISIATIGNIDSATSLRFMRDGSGNNKFGGALTAVRCFNRVLTALEVANLYFDGIVPSAPTGSLSPLIGEWLMDNGGTTARDTSGYGHDGTVSVATFSLDAPLKERLRVRNQGTCIDFSGASDVVDVGTDFLGTQAVSIVGWAYVRSLGGGSNGTIVNNGKIVFRVTSPGLLSFQSDGATSANSFSNAVPFNKWFHFAAARDAAGLTNLYVNGTLVRTPNGSSGTPTAATSNLFIGNRAALDRNFDGRFDSMRFYNRVLSQAEIQRLYISGNEPNDSPASSLLARYLFDEGSGSVATDTGPYARNGTITGAVYSTDVALKERTIISSPERIRIRDFGTALVFDGVDDSVAIPHAANQLLTSGFTFSAWVNPRSLGETAGRIIDKANASSTSGGWGWSIGGAGSFIFSQIAINGGTSRTSAVFPKNTWIHVVVTVNSGALVTFYLNGIQSGTPGITNAPSGITATVPMTIGNRANATDRTFDGAIDSVRIWNRVLTAAEVAQLYSRGAEYSSGLRSGLIGEYLFNEGSGSTAIDSSTSANDGTITGAVYSTAVALIERTKVT